MKITLKNQAPVEILFARFEIGCLGLEVLGTVGVQAGHVFTTRFRIGFGGEEDASLGDACSAVVDQ